MSDHSDQQLEAAINRFALSRGERSKLKRIISEIDDDKLHRGRLIDLLDVLGRSYTAQGTARRLSLFGRNKKDASVLISRLYQVIERLLQHLDILSGEAKDTQWFREQLRAAPSIHHAQIILDELETHLVSADSSLTRERNHSDLVLATVQTQLDDIVATLKQLDERFKGLFIGPRDGAWLVGDDNDLDTLEAKALEQRAKVFHELTHVTNRLSSLERRVNELRSGVKSKVDLALKDNVTGLYTYQGGMERGEAVFARFLRNRTALSVVTIEFKPIRGSELTPIALADVKRVAANEVVKSVRLSDLVSLSSSDGFLVFLPDTDLPGAKTFADRLLISLETLAFKQFGQAVKLHFRIGVTGAKEGDTLSSVIARSAKAMAQCEEVHANTYTLE